MRRIGLVALFMLTLCTPLATVQEARPQSPRITVVGILHPGNPDPTFPSIAALRQGLSALGYVEGQNIRLEYRWGEGKVEQLPSLAASLVQLNVDVLYTTGPQAMRAAMSASRTIPIVGDNLEDDPVESGFVASIGRPGANVTRLFLNLPDLTGKSLELIKEVVPSARRIAVLWDSTTSPLQLRAVNRAAQSAMIEFRVLEVRKPTEYAHVSAGRNEGQAAGAYPAVLAVDPAGLTARRRVHAQEPAAGHLDVAVVPGGWRPDGVRARSSGLLRSKRQLHRQNFERCKTWRSPG